MPRSSTRSASPIAACVERRSRHLANGMCAGWKPVSECREDHDLLAISAAGLQFGVRAARQTNMCTADRRPTALLQPVVRPVKGAAMQFAIPQLCEAAQFRRQEAGERPGRPRLGAYTKALNRRRRDEGRAARSSLRTQQPLCVFADGRRDLHDGPYAETKEQLGGFYIIIEVPDLDACARVGGSKSGGCDRCGRGSSADEPVADDERCGQRGGGKNCSSQLRQTCRHAGCPVAGYRRSGRRAHSEALLRAITDWRLSGVPANPDAWLVTVARRIDADRWRRAVTAAEGADRWLMQEDERLADGGFDLPDDRLRLMLVCAHPRSIRTCIRRSCSRSSLGSTPSVSAPRF